MTLASRIAAHVRRPTLTLRLGGARVSRVLRARVSQAYGSTGIAAGTVVIRNPPSDPTEGQAITWTWGFDGYEAPGFTGYVTRIIDNSYPATWELEVQDVLWLAQREQRPIQTSPLNTITATAAIAYILSTYAGLTRVDLPTIMLGGVPWTLGQLTPVSWEKTTALAACQEIASTAGYWLYADAGGTVRATPIERSPSDSPTRTFRRGVDLLLSGAPQRIRDGSQVKNRFTVRGASTGVEGAQLFDTFQATHALYPGVTAEGEFSSFLLEYIADVTAVAERLTALWNRRPNTIRARIKADPRLLVGATVAIADSGIGYTAPAPFFVYSLDTELDGASGNFSQNLVLDGGTGSAGYTTIPNPLAVIAYTLERETVNGTAVTVVACDGSGSQSLSGGELVSWAWTTADTPYSGTASSGSGQQFTFILPDSQAPFSITLTVTDTSSKTGTATVAIALSGDVVGSAAEAVHAAGGAAWSYTPNGGAGWNDDARTTTIVAEGAGAWDTAPAADGLTYGSLATSSAEVRRTLDGLASASTLLATAGGAITALHSNARNAARVWRAVGTALERSLDGGTTWAAWGTLPSTIRQIVEDPALDNSVFVLAGANAYNTYRADGTSPGTTWATLYAGPSGATARWLARSEDGTITWICYTGTFTGAALQRIEGGVGATFTGASPAVAEVRAVALTHESVARLVAVDADRRTWIGDAATGVLIQGPTLPTGAVAQHATASRLAPVVYIADFDSVTAATTGALRKLVLGQNVLLPWRLGPAGRQYHMVQLATPGNATVELILIPSGATGSADNIFHYRDGAWTALTPPQPGWQWHQLIASPFNPDQWYLIGKPTAGLETDGTKLRGVGTTDSPLYRSDDAGATWTPIVMAATGVASARPVAIPATYGVAITTTGQIVAVAEIDQAGANPYLVGLWSGATTDATLTRTTLWSGLDGANNVKALAAGQGGDVLVSGSEGVGGATNYRVAWRDAGGAVTFSLTTDPAWWQSIDVLPLSTETAYITNAGGTAAQFSDYRDSGGTTSTASASGGTSIAATADALFVGGGTGVRQVLTITGTPAVSTVAAAGVSVGVVRSDRQSQTHVAARGGSVVYAYNAAVWQGITIPPAATTLADWIEVITR